MELRIKDELSDMFT